MSPRSPLHTKALLASSLLALETFGLMGISQCEDIDADEDGWTLGEGDCDDSNPDIHPGADDICDGIDNDCSGTADDDPNATPVEWCTDADHDGYGSSTECITSCAQPDDGYILDDSDCNDDDRSINPSANETCDDVDENCNGLVDENPIDGDPYPADLDNDGYGDPVETQIACSGPENTWDCDDLDSSEPQTVAADADADAADGSLDAPWTSIQQGIDNADVCVLVRPGTYHEAIDFVGKDIDVFSIGSPADTIIDATGTDSAVATFSSTEGIDAKLRGFTLTGGSGHLEISSTSYICDGQTCTDYEWTYCGGGVYVYGGSPTLSDLVVQGNAVPAGGIIEDGLDTYYISSLGGGLCFMNSRSSIAQVDVIENEADLGGGIYLNERSRLDFDQAYLIGNIAFQGGGAYSEGGTLSMENVISAWNTGLEEGGGVKTIGGTLTITNVTFGHETSPVGGGILATEDAEFTIMNSIVYGAFEGAGIEVGEAVLFDGTYNNVTDNEGGNYVGTADPSGSLGNISVDPLFVDVSDDGDWRNDDWHLESNSPSVDAGNPDVQYNDADHSTNDQGAYGGRDSDWDD